MKTILISAVVIASVLASALTVQAAPKKTNQNATQVERLDGAQFFERQTSPSE